MSPNSFDNCVNASNGKLKRNSKCKLPIIGHGKGPGACLYSSTNRSPLFDVTLTILTLRRLSKYLFTYSNYQRKSKKNGNALPVDLGYHQSKYNKLHLLLFFYGLTISLNTKNDDDDDDDDGDEYTPPQLYSFRKESST
ncbi:hypothetical protein GQX74_006904 [Glossina fuscipes]|nr:hypothetical protein GQX74_006904 [Glossina fuscipes]